MLSGMLLIFAALIVGYLIPISKKSTLDLIIKSTSRLVYVILALMGLSLSAVDNLSENLQLISKYTAVFFLVIGACNLICLPLVDRFYGIQADSKQS